MAAPHPSNPSDFQEEISKMALCAWGGEAEIQGAGLVREILNYIFIKKTVWWWGKIWFIL